MARPITCHPEITAAYLADAIAVAIDSDAERKPVLTFKPVDARARANVYRRIYNAAKRANWTGHVLTDDNDPQFPGETFVFLSETKP